MCMNVCVCVTCVCLCDCDCECICMFVSHMCICRVVALYLVDGKE